MNVAERHARVTALFLRARELHEEGLHEWLNDQCAGDNALRAEVEAMLAADRTDPGFLESPAISIEGLRGVPDSGHQIAGAAAPAQMGDGSPAPLPSRIGKYAVLGRLGEGGAVFVYLAEQDSPRRKVALKVVKPGVSSMGSLRRLEFEAQVLARMQHPGIAQVFESGTANIGAGEQPYFAMELVSGEPLTRFADRQQFGTRERLRLFSRVSDAVEHAHQKGIIHRDLKPSNILVDNEGNPKVLDFGIARATDCDVYTTTLRTDIGQLVGTIPYMSPEQTLGDPGVIDTRSDVYALGIVAYELLTGRLPHDLGHKNIPEAVRIIRDEDPERPSTILAGLRGDVETILLKALEKEPDRRYQAVAELAADVRRYLNNEPISARPASASYQLNRFARRNKALVWGCAATLAALLVGITGTSIQAVRATRERDRAIRAEHQAAAQSRLWLELIHHADSWNIGTGGEVVERLLERMQNGLAQRQADPLTEASMRLAIGQAYLSFGATVPTLPQIRKALPELKRAYELHLVTHGPAAREALTAQQSYATALRHIAGLEDAYTAEQKTLHDLRLQESDDLLQAAYESVERLFSSSDPVRLSIVHDFAVRLFDRDELKESERLLQEVLEIRTATLGEDHPNTLSSLNQLERVFFRSGKYDEAERLQRIVLKGRIKSQGFDHQDTNIARFNLAGLLWQMGRTIDPEKLHQAEVLFREAVQIQEAAIGFDDPRTLMSNNNFAALLAHNRKLEEAESIHRRVLETRKTVLGQDHGNTIRSHLNLGRCVLEQERPKEAERIFYEALMLANASLPPEHPDIARIEQEYGNCLRHLGRLDEAEMFLLSGYEKLNAALNPNHSSIRQALERLILLYESSDRPELAEAYREALHQFAITPRNVLGS